LSYAFNIASAVMPEGGEHLVFLIITLFGNCKFQ